MNMSSGFKTLVWLLHHFTLYEIKKHLNIECTLSRIYVGCFLWWRPTFVSWRERLDPKEVVFKQQIQLLPETSCSKKHLSDKKRTEETFYISEINNDRTSNPHSVNICS